MYRKLLEKMKSWKDDKYRKPLVLEGARQVGKTWLMREFGRSCFEDVAEFNFDKDNRLNQIFETSKDIPRIIKQLSLIRAKAIDPDKTLIIFDEIQECPEALNALKYFKEDHPEYFVVSAGSLLGVYLAKDHSHPVGMVNIMNVNPMSFDEFLQACSPDLHAYYSTINSSSIIDGIFHSKLMDAYHEHLIIGGLPECVKMWVETKDPARILETQKDLSLVYERDFAKHGGKVNPARIMLVFRNISAQLAKENKKFIYSDIQKGARARSFEEAIEWLVTAGLINRLYLAKKNESPLKNFIDLSAFKLYLFDSGLLKYMADIPNDQIVLNADFQFKGALTENYVLQELKTTSLSYPNYFAFEHYEIDFILQAPDRGIIPVEVKASKITAASFNAYNKKYSPPTRIRYSSLGYKKDGNIINIPLYLVGKTHELI